MRAPSDRRNEGIKGPANGASTPAPAPSASIVRSRLFIKYVVLFVAVVSLVLIANGAFDVYFSYKEQRTSLVRVQREQAEAAAGKIGQFIREIESQVGWTTQLPWSAATLEQHRFDALRLLRQDMAVRLQESYANLEQKVELRTAQGTKNSKPERAGSKSYRVFSRLERRTRLMSGGSQDQCQGRQ